ncbi:metallophosphoesterase [Paraflavisolibacter sp. H34]|uniref:metallophosphoesterase n=1 Tax=Huijunlia imazamoxiresistens TaxID=3127457 RepID=UPI0030186648
MKKNLLLCLSLLTSHLLFAQTTLIPSGTLWPYPGNGDKAELIRGPYLQAGSATAMTLRWRTDILTDSKVEVGASPDAYTLSASDPERTTEHILRISGLEPDTKYYYRIGTSTYILQGDSTHFFRTAPPANTNRNIRIAVFGDCGKNGRGYQTGTLRTYLDYVGDNPAELLLIPGDLAYMDGKDVEFQQFFFNVYSPNILRNHVLFPAPGNHDYHTTTNMQRTAPYFRNMTVPMQGESGGIPSKAKNYYAFDWGNMHVLCLDSYGMERDSTYLYDTLGQQATWMKKDLAANTREWLVVMLHHPPYSKGHHDSDVEGPMKRIRARLVPIWERYGVDLVIGSHSHNYERSYLMNGHYGPEASFSAALHAKSNSSGRYNGSPNSCPYITSAGLDNDKGIVYVVSGSAGAYSEVSKGFPHKALPYAFDDGGSLFLEVEGNRLDGKFLRMDGTVADRFTLMHSVNKKRSIALEAGSTTKLKASWEGNYKWSTGESSRSIMVSPSKKTVYTVKDPYGCLTDSYVVTVKEDENKEGEPALRAEVKDEKELRPAAVSAFRVYPTVARQGQRITVQAREGSLLEVLNAQGRVVRHLQCGAAATTLSTANLPAGTYVLRLKGSGKAATQRVVLTR